jgi:hypothetical protein
LRKRQKKKIREERYLGKEGVEKGIICRKNLRSRYTILQTKLNAKTKIAGFLLFFT